MSTWRELAQQAKAWPFAEARRILDRIGGETPDKGYVLFETGYGPSGLPHIGTFGEVARTSMVRHAFATLSDIPTKLVCFSDDMDGLRKVPDNVPAPEMVRENLGKPLTDIPDPFGTHASFGAHNNARLQGFLDFFGFDYEFVSATECYRAGRFDRALLTALANYDAIMDVMLPTLSKERQRTYSPFLPVSPKTGRVLQVPVLDRDVERGTILFADEDGERTEVPVTGGHCKMQWKPDWAMRWFALDVDYEMAGKDLIDSAKLGNRLVSILGGKPPVGFHYELFLDEQGEKISKSKGNGLSVDEWLTYGPWESLSLFMYQKPKSAKKLSFDVIPRNVDDYLAHRRNYHDKDDAAGQLENPAWHVHCGAPPVPEGGPSYSMLLNLASAANTEDKATLWGFISRYTPDVTPDSAPFLDRLVDHAVAYYRDFVHPAKQYRAPSAEEAAALRELLDKLRALPADADAETIQGEFYAVGKAHPDTFSNLRAWFKAIYEILLGQQQGPRLGSFVALYGLANFIALAETTLHQHEDV
ncbi:lysyl-tRNA synthetase, class I [Limimonas halophila]|uniref:Lysine--tRNA ligase n=1 Tax=Limimonas halophila TaxID=1082479 RepID=A0A1G7VAG3_9PROT|nr:lysine--tRNA ligase [Limimonas halophila]SDG56568.1 lysyl-tRNA synthetase, class I [Limimonas halophila]